MNYWPRLPPNPWGGWLKIQIPRLGGISNSLEAGALKYTFYIAPWNLRTTVLGQGPPK